MSSPSLRSALTRSRSARAQRARKASRRTPRSRQLRCEALEQRLLLATYPSGDVPTDIPDEGFVTSILNVPDDLLVHDVNVRVNITHPNDADLDVYLRSPLGTLVELFTDVGGGGNNFEDTILNDQAASPITIGTAPFSGEYQPEGSLASFNGEYASGTWTLEITDDKKRNSGILLSWSLMINDEGGPSLPTLTIDDVQLVEGDSGTTAFVFTVTRAGDLSQPSTVDYATVDDTARTSDDDYLAVNGTLSFDGVEDENIEEETQTITVEVNGDTTVEYDETFYVDLSQVVGATIADSRGVGTIVNDDTEPVLPTLAIDDVQLIEGDSGNSTVVFTITRSGDLSQPSTVDYSTVDGTATTSDLDYVGTSGTCTFNADEETKPIPVEVVGDTFSEGNEVFYVDLSAPDNAVISVPRGTGLIVGDDGGLAPPPGLISWWTADGTATDLMQRNNATLANGTTYATGKVGHAFSFDGVDDRVQVADSDSLKLTSSMTIEGWIRVNALTSSTNFETILFRGDSRGGLDPYDLHVNPNGNLHFGISSLTDGAAVEAPVPIGQLIHVAATLDDATGAMKLYLDGDLAAQTVTTVRPFRDLDPTMNPGIGIGSANSTYNVPFNGLIDELSVYNRALTSDEVQRIYHTGGQGKVKMTVAKTTPDSGSVVTTPPPTQFVVDFTYPVDPSSVEADDLQVNDSPADSVVLEDADTATFTFESSPVTSERVQTIYMSENAVARASDGLGLAEYSSEFRYDVTLLAVTHTDPPAGSDLVLEELATPTTAVLSMAGMDGGNGGWPVLYGSDPVSENGLRLAIDEDQLFDTERSHTTEQAAFAVFENDGVINSFLETGVVSNVAGTWQPVTLGQSYDSMVVVATPNYDSTSPPLVTQVRTVSGSSFDIRVVRADGLSAPFEPIDVHYIVVEEGNYTEMDGLKMEAHKFTSDVTDYAGSADYASHWIGQPQEYGNTYTSPVVLGQVMTANEDPDFSVFWARGASSADPPSSTTLFVGKHVGEDSDPLDPTQPPTRVDETIGYIVFEEGKGSIGGLEYLAGVGGDTVVGMDDGPSTYRLNVTSLQVHFNEHFDPDSLGTDDLKLSSGVVRRAEIVGENTVSYTLGGVGPGLRVDMLAGALVDQFGNPMLPFSATYSPETTKFYVVDNSADRTFEYGASGSSLSDDSWSLTSQTYVKGATANAEGTKVWVLDGDGTVDIYDTDGGAIGSWNAIIGAASTATGIATNGTDIWIVEWHKNRVLRYSNAASRTSGDQRPDSWFPLDGTWAEGITTDGSTIWVLDSRPTRVYMYTMDGELISDWPLFAANSNPKGVTIDPSGVSTSIWVVDATSSSVYEYQRDTGAFLGSFALDTAAGNTQPQGIADPPPRVATPVSMASLVELNSPASGQVDLWTAVSHDLVDLPGTVPVPAPSQLVSLLASPLLPPESRPGATQPDLVDHTLLLSGAGRHTDTDSDMLLLPLVPADYVELPRTSPEATVVRILHDAVDEETELLEEELLELLALAAG